MSTKMASDIHKYINENKYTYVSTSSLLVDEKIEIQDTKIHVTDAKVEPYEIDNSLGENAINVHQSIVAVNNVKSETHTELLNTVIVPIENVKEERDETMNFPDVKIELSTSNAYLNCENCGEEYKWYCSKCPMLLHILDNNFPNNTVDRPKNTIPKNFLEIRQSSTGLGVFALAPIPKDVKFGPFISTSCMSKSKGGKLIANNAEATNWMRYVNCAEHVFDKNLEVFQHERYLYYRSDRIIDIGEELLVYYGKRDIKSENDADIYYQPATEKESPDVYACTFCCLGFDSQTNLVKHKLKCPYAVDFEPPVSAIVQCSFCKMYMGETEHSEYHKKYCSVKYISKWNSSDNALQSKTNASATLKNIHNPKSTCENNINLNTAAGKKHTGKDDNKHNHRKKYSCPKCTYETNEKSNLNRHVRTHDGLKSFVCQICDRGFTQKSSLKTHIKNHTGEKPHECQYCDYKSCHKSSILIHTKSVHTNAKDYRCVSCGYGTNLKQNFEKHLIVHADIKAFSCEFCKKSFRTKAYLKAHVRLHKGEEPFTCNRCVYKCNQKLQLIIHYKNVHTTAKEYRCSKCSYGTNTRSYLVRHSKVHEGANALKCEICDEYFTRKTHLEHHNLRHGSKEKSCFNN